MYTNENLEIVNENDPYTALTGVKYPSNYPKGEIEELMFVTLTEQPDDTDTHIVDGFSFDENAVQVWNLRERTVEELQEISNKPMSDWLDAMAVTDVNLPRCVEDLIDGIGTNSLPQFLVDNYNAKKALRAEKPE